PGGGRFDIPPEGGDDTTTAEAGPPAALRGSVTHDGRKAEDPTVQNDLAPARPTGKGLSPDASSTVRSPQLSPAGIILLPHDDENEEPGPEDTTARRVG